MTVNTKEKLVCAARRLAASEGIKDFSIERIVKEAGVSKGAFLYHFPAKELMFAQLVDATIETTLKALKETALDYNTQDSVGADPQVKNCRRIAEGMRILAFVAANEPALRNVVHLHFENFTSSLRKLGEHSEEDLIGKISLILGRVFLEQYFQSYSSDTVN